MSKAYTRGDDFNCLHFASFALADIYQSIAQVRIDWTNPTKDAKEATSLTTRLTLL